MAYLIAHVLEYATGSETHRIEALRFCRRIAEQTHVIGLGHLHHLRKTVKPLIAQTLRVLDEDRMPAPPGGVLGRQLTIQQPIARLDPHQPLEIQARAVTVLPHFRQSRIAQSACAVK